MAFDKETRNLLAKTVAACRRRLIEDVTDQLRGVFGLHPDGTVLPLDKLTHLSPDQNSAARRLRDLLDHYTVGAAGKDSDRRKAAYERMVLEISFTALNRLAALRLCEERGLVVECVRKGTTSAGFQMFERISGGALGGRYDTYRVFLECMFDELAGDLGVLFDRMTPQSAVFPSERCMEDVLAELNRPELTHLWTEDETIGWVYQYFNPPEERKAMREASQAPRNSRELAVRNQFFTPRYVVEFLTDNTLGRIWYEMRKGDTFLKEECRYLVRRPSEVFLGPGEKAPAEKGDETDLSQEELLKRPVYIEHRPKKDPRDLRILDPACGSGHFLLYAFDLLEHIYGEAWSDVDSPKSEVTGRTLQEDFKTLDDLRREVPKLIVEHNLHGIDIDPRAVQIAALALWLRAQKTWKTLGLKADARPRIAKSNIVTAEPMPGEDDMRREFTAGLKPRVLGQLVDVVFEKMKLAGEAGSLLKIEEEIKDAVAAAGKQWREGPKPEQQLLFPTMDAPRPKQPELRFDVKGITDVRFWEQAEDRILDALKEYAERAENGRATRRRLFAEDAARGFAFIDMCRKRYDTVLMNPPFGEASRASRGYIDNKYPQHKTEILACFVSRSLESLHEFGMSGVLSSRTVLVNATCEALRKEMGQSDNAVAAVADLGYGVLDAAMVEAAAYVSIHRRNDIATTFLSMLKMGDKETSLLSSVADLQAGKLQQHVYLFDIKQMEQVFRFPWAYWLPPEILSVFQNNQSLEDSFGRVRVGSSTADNWQFLRLSWEIPNASVASSSAETFQGLRWATLAKGGEYSPFFDDLHLLIDWAAGGAAVRAFKGSTIRSPEDYFIPGCTYPYRTTSAFSLRVLPRGCIFADGGPAILTTSSQEKDLWALLSYFNTRIARYFMETFLGEGDAVVSGSAARNYIPRAVGATPIPDFTNIELDECSIKNWFRANVISWTHDETSRVFVGLDFLQDGSLRKAIRRAYSDGVRVGAAGMEASHSLESSFSRALGLSAEGNIAIAESFGIHPCEFDRNDIKARTIEDLISLPIDQLVDVAAERCGHARYISKKSYYVDRRIELIARITETHPINIAECIALSSLVPADEMNQRCTNLLNYFVGIAFGRWDIRIAIDPSLAPKLPDPFDPLPICPPGMLVGSDGLPAEPNGIVSEEWLRARPDANTLPPKGMVKNPTVSDDEYPLRISWGGVLVDDPGFTGDRPHRNDIVRRVREVFDLLWKDKAHEIEQEACDILGVSDLRDYFRKPTGFFQDHLKRYSKSRRKAPIYWPLSTPSGSYTIWLYYHRLTDQTIYAAVNKYIEPKISEVERGIGGIENDLKSASGRDGTRLTDRLGEARTFLGELRDLREELLRIAALPYKPDLNDGVIINASPFHNLFRLRPWAKDTADCWKKLEKGDYDWAHLAYTIRPDRVREVCRTDRSIAIAHGLENLCEVEAPGAKKKGGPGRRKREAAR